MGRKKSKLDAAIKFGKFENLWTLYVCVSSLLYARVLETKLDKEV